MIIKAEASTLSALWASLGEPAGVVHHREVSRHVAAIVDRGWAPRFRVQDLLHDMGAPWFWREADVNALFDVPRQTVFDRPRADSASVMGFDETAAADFAHVLIQIERLGVAIDPSPLVEALRPALLKRPVLTRSELHVVWYAKERHKMEAITVEAPNPPLQMRPEQVTLPTGYKAEAHRDPAGAVGSITVKAPKHRRMRWAA